MGLEQVPLQGGLPPKKGAHGNGNQCSPWRKNRRYQDESYTGLFVHGCAKIRAGRCNFGTKTMADEIRAESIRGSGGTKVSFGSTPNIELDPTVDKGRRALGSDKGEGGVQGFHGA